MQTFRCLTWLLLLLLPAAADAAEQCTADCTHQSKACVCAIDGRNLTVIAIGGVERQPLRLGQALEPGDELASADANAVVALTCPGSSAVNLHGRFRSIVLPPAAGQDCALSLLAGSADVQTTQPTQLSAGTTLMGSKRTMYGMRVAADAAVTCVVFEGEVEVQNLATGAIRPLGASMSASWKSGVLQHYGTPITQADLASTARSYARAETARARARAVPVTNPTVLQRELEARYAAVLKTPQNVAARIDLAGLQTRASLSVPALYQLAVAERLGPQLPEQAATIATTRWVIYKQERREQEAAREADKLRTLDPARYKQLQQIEAKAAPAERGQATVTVAATPPIVAAGEPTTIAVTITTASGQPISGVKVVVSASGGTFTGPGRAQVAGATSTDGLFLAQWRCQPCAPAYQFGIEVSGAGLQSQRTTIGVKTR